jgi:transposase InsO family protein
VLRRPLEPGQYRSLALGKTLRETGIMQSMGSRGDAYDNAEAESVMSTIKNELVNRHRFKTRDDARFAIFRYIEGFYNPHRWCLRTMGLRCSALIPSLAPTCTKKKSSPP